MTHNPPITFRETNTVPSVTINQSINQSSTFNGRTWTFLAFLTLLQFASAAENSNSHAELNRLPDGTILLDPPLFYTIEISLFVAAVVCACCCLNPRRSRNAEAQ